jgi:hypothetical protein
MSTKAKDKLPRPPSKTKSKTKATTRRRKTTK